MFYKKIKYCLVSALVIICSNTAFTSDLIDKESQETSVAAQKIDSDQIRALHDRLFEGVTPINQASPEWREARVTINKPVSFFLAFNDKPVLAGGKPLSIQTWFESIEGNNIKKVVDDTTFYGDTMTTFPQRKVMTIVTDDRSSGAIALQINVKNLKPSNFLGVRAMNAEPGTIVSLELFLRGQWTLLFSDYITTSLKEFPIKYQE
jgi:hypothetical protein